MPRLLLLGYDATTTMTRTIMTIITTTVGRLPAAAQPTGSMISNVPGLASRLLKTTPPPAHTNATATMLQLLPHCDNTR